MVDLKKDLDEYLLLHSDQRKVFNLHMPSIEAPNITRWFMKESLQQEEHTWFRRITNQCFPTLSRFQRIVFFAVCLALGCLCFLMSSIYIPVLVFKARKFALLFTLGSIFFVLGFFFLWGPIAFIRYMFARERLLVTITYGGSLGATLFTALHLQNLPFTVTFAVVQVLSLLWSLIAIIPGGTSGLSFIKKILCRSTRSSLPI
ncbi:unnamed protein product [Diabrotica balteata]|uniref:Vesicle transport protein n=1 Tax=Diabrotica balteata TaxID=107213 RepID=A0A9N9SYF2_DIABA|nr:unnamed protein product [Diabrotica balteata]